MTTKAFGLTPSQTVGPYLHIGLSWADGPQVVPEGTAGAFLIRGRVLDGAGAPVVDALIESWQADAQGRFAHPDDPRGNADPAFRGFGRCPTDSEGRYWLRTVKPGTFPTRDGATEAPHLNVSVFARGLLDRVVTRLYFGDDPDALATDPLLSTIAPDRRDTLIARVSPDGYEFDIHLQGDHETIFFDV